MFNLMTRIRFKGIYLEFLLFIIILGFSVISMNTLNSHENTKINSEKKTFQSEFLISDNAEFLLPEIIVNCSSDNPGRLCLTDVNEDGYNDLFVAHWYSSLIDVFIWNPDIGYWDKQILTHGGAGKIAVEDVNNDGKKDIITLDYINWLQISLWNEKTETWDYPIVKMPCRFPDELSVGDADNDGNNEILVLDSENNRIYIYEWNHITEDWDMFTIAPADQIMTIGDINNDGLNEIVTSYFGVLSTFYIYNWSHTLEKWVLTDKYFDDPSNPQNYSLWDVSLGDVNNDGYIDLLFSDYDLYILIWNNSIKDWNKELISIPEMGYCDVIVDDINGDGFHDLIINGGKKYFLLCWNNTLGTWNPAITKDLKNNGKSLGLVVGDINNDGLTDFAMGNSVEIGISLFLGYYTIDNSPILEPIFPYISYDNRTVNLHWTNVDRATIYYIYRDTELITSINNRKPIGSTSELNYTDTVHFNNMYYYAVVGGDNFIYSQISNCRDCIVAMNLSSQELSSGIHCVDLCLHTLNFDINVTFSFHLTNDTRIFYSYYIDNPFNDTTVNDIMFIEVMINNTHNINGNINITIQYTNLINLEFWRFNEVGEREKVWYIISNNSYMVLSIDQLSLFSISGALEPQIICFDLIILMIMFCVLTLSIIIKFRINSLYNQKKESYHKF